jgi:hypothetical protein
MNITKEQATWLIEEYNPMRMMRVDRSTIGNHIKAINIILDQNRTVPKCASCEWRAIANIASNVYEQYEQLILAVYNSTETTSKRGRKKKNG